jgi:RNA polymerase sigma-70 factor (ECF subfamily)
MGGLVGTFWTTRWSLINGVDSPDREASRSLIEELLKRYWKPVYCYLRRRGYPNEQAKDLTQGFFHEVVLGRHLIERADPAKGRFRSFLLIALDRYLANVHRAETAQKRIPKASLVSLDMVGPLEMPTVVDRMSPEAAFDYVWVSTLLEQVLEDVKSKCCEDGMKAHWSAFQDRVLTPITQQTKAVSLGEICQRHGIKDERQASNMIITVKRRVHAALTARLRDTVMSDEDVGVEMEAIQEFFLRAAQ